MQPSSAFLLALLAFINLIAAMVIPKADNGVPGAIAAVVGQTTTNHQQKFPFNTTDWELSPPFVVLAAAASSSSSSNTEGTTINPSHVHDRRSFGPSTTYQVYRKIKPYCPFRKSEHRACATQKEVDQGWHDTNGCHRIPALRFLGIHYEKCWVAGARCIKKNCKY